MSVTSVTSCISSLQCTPVHTTLSPSSEDRGAAPGEVQQVLGRDARKLLGGFDQVFRWFCRRANNHEVAASNPQSRWNIDYSLPSVDRDGWTYGGSVAALQRVEEKGEAEAKWKSFRRRRKWVYMDPESKLFSAVNGMQNCVEERRAAANKGNTANKAASSSATAARSMQYSGMSSAMGAPAVSQELDEDATNGMNRGREKSAMIDAGINAISSGLDRLGNLFTANCSLFLTPYAIRHMPAPYKGTPEYKRREFFLRVTMVKYLTSVVEPPEEALRAQPNEYRTIDSFCAGDCRMYFRFLKPDLYYLFELLDFPPMVRPRNRSWQTGEEIFLWGLCEIATGMQQDHLANLHFGGVGSDQSLAFKWFVNFIWRTQRHLVQENLPVGVGASPKVGEGAIPKVLRALELLRQNKGHRYGGPANKGLWWHNFLPWWYRNGWFQASADAVSRKMGCVTTVGFFIDCNCLATSVVGGGPGEAGANSARWDDQIQRAFYNGWKYVHGLKHQTVDNAYGFTVDMAGPTSLRRSDLNILGVSNIRDRIGAVQAGDSFPVIIFGNSAYKVPRPYMRSYFQLAEQVEDYVEWNRRMKTVRISIEWNYGFTASLFNTWAGRTS
ncbi:hypothetical protein B484DRAFT_401266 [Ochromonadaceae sp. CCMP2298]|nr:hypothetical protein B484DRAFT_401266 [Ochromonadaceae sp. CCMP2298]